MHTAQHTFNFSRKSRNGTCFLFRLAVILYGARRRRQRRRRNFAPEIRAAYAGRTAGSNADFIHISGGGEGAAVISPATAVAFGGVTCRSLLLLLLSCSFSTSPLSPSLARTFLVQSLVFSSFLLLPLLLLLCLLLVFYIGSRFIFAVVLEEFCGGS